MSDEPDAERTTVTTYVPRYQKEVWQSHAEALGMSQSEYVRTMVQSGRRGFEIDTEPSSLEGRFEGSTPGGDGLETRILDTLRSGGIQSWERLVESLSDDFEDRLEEALDSLQRKNRIRYSGRHGGYEVVDE